MSTSSPKWSRKSVRRGAGVSAAALIALLAACGDAPNGGAVIGPPPTGGIAWGAPTVLAGNVAELGAPAAAVDPAGLAAVLWTQPDGGSPARPVVTARVNTVSAGWGATDTVEQLALGDGAGDVHVGLQASGPTTGVTALWTRQRATAGDAVRSVLREANGWSFEAVPLLTSATVTDLAFAANDAGVQAALWVQPVNGVPQVFLSVRRVGAGGVGWSAVPLQVQTAASVAGSQPALAVDPSGVVMLLWRQGSAPASIFSRTYDANSGLPGAQVVELSPNQLNDMRRPRVAALGFGSFLATWEQDDAGGLYSLRSLQGTAVAWQGTPDTLEARTDTVTGSVLLAGPNQSAIAAWQQSGTLFCARFAAGLWSQAVQFGSGLTGTSADLRLAIDSGGNAIAAWLQRLAGGGAADLYATRLPIGVAPLAPGLVESDDADAAAPSLAMNPTGAAIIAWLQAQPGQTERSLVARVLR